MKTIKFCILFSAIFIFLVLSVTGCNPAEEYTTSLMTVYEGTKINVKQIDLQSARISIQRYMAVNNKFPDSLEEIGQFMGVELDPQLYSYNPETGKITMEQQF